MREQSLVIVHVAPTRTEAEAIVAYLAARGIRAIAMADDAGGTAPNLAFVQGVPVVVQQASFRESRRILDEVAR